MPEPNGPTLGASLRELRLARRIGMAEAALRAGLAKGTLSKWESDHALPRGAPLARLLDALEAEPRRRARLLHAADPAHARIELAHTPLGAPVDVGTVLRAMRRRRGTTQADLARAVGVTQATVARWESGDIAPTQATLHAAGFALGASAEEAVALACARGEHSGGLPEAPFETLEATNLGLNPRLPRGPLHEVVSLGLEAELWAHAARDARWEPMLAFVLGDRAVRHFLDGRLAEAEETAKRALRLPPTSLGRLCASGAFSALLEVATHRGASPARLAERIGAWTARLPDGGPSADGGVKKWMRWERALRLGEVGRPEEGLTLIRPDEEEEKASAVGGGWWTPAGLAAEQARARMEIELRAGRGDRAEELIPDYEKGDCPDRVRRRVRVAHAQGRAADEATMEAMRAEPLGPADHWYTRSKLARIEREQARLARRP